MSKITDHIPALTFIAVDLFVWYDQPIGSVDISLFYFMHSLVEVLLFEK